jgi:hypothetical protein
LNGQWHRINFWQYSAPKSDQGYFYLDVSRGSPTIANDSPSTPWNFQVPWIYPLKRVHERDASGDPLTFKFANEGKFQIMHCGIDGSWGNVETILWSTAKPAPTFPAAKHMNYLRMDIDGNGTITPEERKALVVFPEGPWMGDLSDTQVNFSPEMTVEDVKP